MRASRAEWLDKIEVRPLSPAEVKELRARVEAMDNPFACDCISCKLRRLREAC